MRFIAAKFVILVLSFSPRSSNQYSIETEESESTLDLYTLHSLNISTKDTNDSTVTMDTEWWLQDPTLRILNSSQNSLSNSSESSLENDYLLPGTKWAVKLWDKYRNNLGSTQAQVHATITNGPLFSAKYKFILQDSQVLSNPHANEIDSNGTLRALKGTAYKYHHRENKTNWKPVGWVRLAWNTELNTVSGGFVDNSTISYSDKMWYIGSKQALKYEHGISFNNSNALPAANVTVNGSYKSTNRPSVLAWTISDQQFSAGNTTEIQSLPSTLKALLPQRHRRDSQIASPNEIGGNSGCPSERRTAVVGLLGDCNFLASFDGDKSQARQHLIEMVNLASQAFETGFNLELNLGEIILANDTNCPISPSLSNTTGGDSMSTAVEVAAAAESESAESANRDTDMSWNYDCEFQRSSAMSDRLYRVSEWRASRPDSYASWTLLTTCTQTSVVGLSWMGQVCSPGFKTASGSSVAGTNIVTKTRYGWRVYAHELGHSFGAVHDCDSSMCEAGLGSPAPSASSSNSDDQNDTGESRKQCCPLQGSGTCDAQGQYLMNAATSESQSLFSPCTIATVCKKLAFDLNSTSTSSSSGASQSLSPVNSTCLVKNAEPGIQLNQCGNGVVETGEECDGGPCCTSNCKLISNAQCDDSRDACCYKCRFSASGTPCGPTGPCLSSQHCSGDSGTCPSTQSLTDGTSCSLPVSFNASLSTGDSDTLQCVSGQCTSRSYQCVTALSNLTITLHDEVIQPVGACPDDSLCQLSCYDGTRCFSTSQEFLDGTPCGGGAGRCLAGKCESRDNGGKRWRNAVIVAAGVVGGVLVLAAAGYLAYRTWIMGKNKTKKPIEVEKRSVSS